MKLELKHIAPYLPYNLKIQRVYEGMISDTQYSDIEQLQIDDVLYYFGDNCSEFNSIKLVLHPISDLTKEIVIDGENVLFCDYITDKYGDCETFYSFNNGAIIEDAYRGEDAIHHKYLYPNPECYPYFIIKELLKLNVDVFGLIKEGLAIDFNTLKTKPNE